MKRILVCLLAAGLLGSVAAGLTFYRGGGQPAPSLRDAVGAETPVFDKNLYSSVPDSSGAVSPILSSVQIGNKIWVTNRDGSTVDIELKPGTKDLLSSLSYYPVQVGEVGRRPHVVQLYDQLPGVTFDEVITRLDGTVSEHTQKLADKTRHIIDYGPDGTTFVAERWYDDNVPYSDPVLKKEERWHLDKGHTLAYLNQFNADETRTITAYDDQLRPLKVINLPKYGIAAGSTAVGYFPGTFKKRMEAASDYYQNVVNYFRESDGTLWYKVTLSPSLTEVVFYDATGKVPTMKQAFWRHTKVEDGVTKFTYGLYIFALYDAQGNEIRNVSFRGGYDNTPTTIDEDEVSNVTVNGVKYFRLDYQYDNDGNLTTVTYWRNEVHFPPEKKDEHQPSEHLRFTPLPAEDMTLTVPIDEDLPIPPPQSSFEH